MFSFLKSSLFKLYIVSVIVFVFKIFFILLNSIFLYSNILFISSSFILFLFSILINRVSFIVNNGREDNILFLSFFMLLSLFKNAL